MADYGQTSALNFRTGASEAANNEINDILRGHQLRKENEALAIAKQKLFNDDIDFQNGSNAFDSNIIKNENQQLISNLGKFVNENPDWATNPFKAAELKRMKQEFKSSPAVLRSVAYKQSVDEYNKYLQAALKEPNKYNLDQLDSFKHKINNYNQFGNSDGPDAVKTQGHQPLVFTPPEEIPNMEEMHRKAGDSMNPDDFQTLRNGRDGAYTGKVSNDKLIAKAQELYSQNKSVYDYLYKDQPDKIKAITAAIDPYTKKEYHVGERNVLADQMALESYKAKLKQAAMTPGASAYDIAILNTGKQAPGKEILSETFTSTAPNFFTSPDGKLVQNTTDPFHYDGDIYDEGFRDDGKYKKTGVKEMPGYILKNVDWAKDAGYLYDPWGISGRKGTDYEVRPEFKDRVEIIDTPPDKEGKVYPVVKVKAVARVNANSPMYRNKFDKGVLTTKQRDAAGVEESTLENGGGEYQGYPIGSVVQTDQGNYRVTENGFIKQ